MHRTFRQLILFLLERNKQLLTGHDLLCTLIEVYRHFSVNNLFRDEHKGDRMEFIINGLNEERFGRGIQLIANLFFEDPVISFEDGGAGSVPAVKVDFSICEDDKVTVSGVLTTDGGKRYTASFSKELVGNDRKEHLNGMKKAVSACFLSMLQEWTGIIQPWGILTGIRPTKLLHKFLRQGMSREKAHEKLKQEYFITDKKIQLMQKIVDNQLAAIPDLYDLQKEVSIYIGIPFCPTKCAYCTFPAYAINGRQGSVSAFLEGLHIEMEKIGQWLKENNIPITTIYFGGGTPTSITAEEMDSLYEKMHSSFPYMEKVREITVEAGRPDTITREKLDVLKKWNINRISINPQSYIQQTLKAIGRHHTVEETVEKFHLAREAGMTNINMDLIIGLPGEGVEEFAHSLKETEKLLPESLTVHTLSFKKASEMTKNKEKYKVAGREEIQEMMALAEKWMEKLNYTPYYLYRQKNILGNLENVGYSRRNMESLYNIIIMEEQQTIIGLGCGAASKLIDPATGKITHFANPKEPKTYEKTYEQYINKKIDMLNSLFKINSGAR